MHTQRVKRAAVLAGFTAVMAVPAAPAAGARIVVGAPSLMSRTPTGTAGNGVSGVTGIAVSGDGASVAFSSMATNLVIGTQLATPEIYVRRPGPGTTELASATSSGQEANAISSWPSLSFFGRRVAFLSAASNLDPVTGGQQQVDAYVKSLTTGALTRASTSSTGRRANGPTSEVTLSGNGREAAFVSTATNLDPRDTDTGPDVYVKNLRTGAVTLASVTPSGTKPAATGVRGISLSRDGRWLAFSTDAALASGASGATAQVYVKDLATGSLLLASATAGGTMGDAPSTDPVLTADGRAVVFRSFADNLSPGDRSHDSDVYRKDLSTGALSLVSTNSAGQKGNNSSSMPAVSGDGRVVAFASYATNLQSGTSTPPGWLDIFVKDLTTGQVADVSRRNGPEPSGATSVYPALAGHPTNVAFATNNTFTTADTNGIADVYRAPLGYPSR